jgi:hypothetical protein
LHSYPERTYGHVTALINTNFFPHGRKKSEKMAFEVGPLFCQKCLVSLISRFDVIERSDAWRTILDLLQASVSLGMKDWVHFT